MKAGAAGVSGTGFDLNGSGLEQAVANASAMTANRPVRRMRQVRISDPFRWGCARHSDGNQSCLGCEQQQKAAPVPLVHLPEQKTKQKNNKQCDGAGLFHNGSGSGQNGLQCSNKIAVSFCKFNSKVHKQPDSRCEAINKNRESTPETPKEIQA